MFLGVKSDINGGAICCSIDNIIGQIKDCYFVNCVTSSGEGGALFFDKGGKYEIRI